MVSNRLILPKMKKSCMAYRISTCQTQDSVLPRGSPVVSEIPENEYCCCLRDRITSFSARVISCYLRSEDHRPHNSLEKNRLIGPPIRKKETHRNDKLSLLVIEAVYTLTAICGIIHL